MFINNNNKQLQSINTNTATKQIITHTHTLIYILTRLTRGNHLAKGMEKKKNDSNFQGPVTKPYHKKIPTNRNLNKGDKQNKKTLKEIFQLDC